MGEKGGRGSHQNRGKGEGGGHLERGCHVGIVEGRGHMERGE